MTSFLFSAGKIAIGVYLGRSAVTSIYGAAGSLVTLLLWVYYSSLIFFFGAEFTQVFAAQFGSGVVPAQNAEKTGTQKRQSPPPAERAGHRAG
jgi:membrane protein